MHHIDPSESHEDNSPPLDSSSNDGAQNSSRRSFLIKGAVAAPILAAFVNKPLWAAGGDDCISSGSMSGNLSNHQCAAVSRSANWWTAASDSMWTGIEINGTSLSPDSLFSTVFTSEPLNIVIVANAETYHEKVTGEVVFRSLNADGVDGQRSLRYVLINGTPVDRELIAALLNIGHPGIKYDGHVDSLALISDYQGVKESYITGVSPSFSQSSINAYFDAFIAQLANFNRDYDILP